METRIGRGQVVSGGEGVGVVRAVDSTAEVLALLGRDDLGVTILLVESASATAVVPLLSSVRGIICRSGGTTSHLAIVSREFGQLCVMGAELDDGESLDGQSVRVGSDGEIFRL